MHCTDQLLRLKWACFLLGEQFPTPGRLGEGPSLLNPSPPTPSTPGFLLGSLIAIWAFWKTKSRTPAGTSQAAFLVPLGLLSLPSTSLPAPNYREGLGVACKPSSGFVTAWLLQSHLCRSHSLYAETAALRGAGLGLLVRLGGRGNRGTLAWGGGWESLLLGSESFYNARD